MDNPLVRHRARVRPLRLLVADDLASNRTVMAGCWNGRATRWCSPATASRRFDALAAEPLDAAILDLHMPDNQRAGRDQSRRG